jgi:Holliday junction resolvase RusA-like endonuclease
MGSADQLLLPDLGPAPLVAGPIFLAFELMGPPGHKGRHRHRVITPKGGGRAFAQVYPDPQTEAYERTLAEAASLYMRGKRPAEGPLALLVHAYREVPASWSERDKAMALAGAIRPTSRPDWDNYAKIVDALNGIVWRDDAQIVDGRAIKQYSRFPALRIEVREFVTNNLKELGTAREAPRGAL